MLEKFLEKAFNRKVRFPKEAGIFYKLGFINEQIFNILRSLRFIFYRNIAAGKFFVAKRVTLKCKEKVTISKGVKLGENVYIDGYGYEGIKIGAGSSVGAYSRLICSGSIFNTGKHIHIGNGVGIGEFSRIGGSGGVTIGDNTIIAQYFSAHPENHLFLDKTTLIKNQGTEKAEIKIGENCWIGSKVTILAGVEIGEGVVVAAGSVVTKSFGSHVVIGGVPARVLKEY